jgi:hypothetical protein
MVLALPRDWEFGAMKTQPLLPKCQDVIGLEERWVNYAT